MEGIVQQCPRDEWDGWSWSHPKRHREEALAGYPKGAKALKTLDDEGVLNGYAANFAANMNEAHYKNNGVANGIAEETAKYMLRSNIEDRRRWCEKLVTGNTWICSVVQVIEAYRQARATLMQQNATDTTGWHGKRIMVIDANGVIH